MSRLGSLLVREGLLTEPDRKMIHRESGTHRGSFARSILALGVLDEHELAALFAAKTSYRIASKNLSDELEDDVLGLIPAHILNWLDVLPLKRSNGVLHVAMTDPTDQDVIAQLEFFSGMIIKPVIASFSTIHRALNRHLGSHQDFGRSEFEEFLKNHSVNATKFATSGLAMNRPTKTKVSSASQDLHASSGSSAEIDSILEQGGTENEQTGVESMSFSPNEETNSGAADAASTDVVEMVDDTVVFESDGDGDVSVTPAGEQVPERALSSENAASDAGPLGQDIDVSGLDGDLDFNLDDENNNATKAPSLVATDEPISANLDEIVSSSGTELPAEADLSAVIGDGETRSIEAQVAGANEDLNALENDSLSLDEPSELATETLAADPEAEATTDASVATPEQSVVDDFSLPDDIVGDLGEATPLEVAPDLTEQTSTESPLTEDSLSMSMDEDPSLALVEPVESVETHDLLETSDIDVSASVGPDVGDFDLDTLAESDESVDVSPAADAVATQETDFDTLEDLGVSDMDASPAPEVVSADVPPEADVSGSAHVGIAALNRALVNMALLMDSKKVLTRAADAAGQVGIESGAIALWNQSVVQPGVMWNRAGAEFGVIYDVPAGLTADAINAAVTAASGRDEWITLAEGLTNKHATALVSAWPNAEQAPTHVVVKKRTDGSVIVGLARFTGDADHDGLRQSFAELVKTAGAKM